MKFVISKNILEGQILHKTPVPPKTADVLEKKSTERDFIFRPLS